eukprot:PhF_6_TR1544/c0_g1_i1/m.2815
MALFGRYVLLTVVTLLVIRADVEQVVCTDTDCSVGCKIGIFPEGQCLPISGGGTTILRCTTNDGVREDVWPSSSSCSGFNITQYVQTGVCLRTQSGASAATNCVSGRHPPLWYTMNYTTTRGV